MSKLIRVHRCIGGVKEQYYSRDKEEIDRLKRELSLRVRESAFHGPLIQLKERMQTKQSLKFIGDIK